MHVRPTSVGRLPTRPALVAAIVLVAAATITCGIPPREGWELAPLPAGRPEVVRLSSGPVLNVERVRFLASELGEPRFFLAIVPAALPASPNAPAATVRKVLVLNHGWKDRPEYLVRNVALERVYAEMLSSGEVEPAILVVPDIRFPERFRRESAKYPFQHGLVLVADDVAGMVASHYRVPPGREHWGVGGFSFGGYLALDIVRRYSGRFGSASVISGFADEAWTFWPPLEPPPGRLDSRGRGKQTVVVPGPVPRLLLACGTGDRLFGSMRSLHERLTAQGFAHQWLTAPGGHTWRYWASVLRPMLRFHLAADGPPPGRGPDPSV